MRGNGLAAWGEKPWEADGFSLLKWTCGLKVQAQKSRLKRGLPSGGFYGIMFGYAGGISADGPSPSGKAQDFDSCIRGFESRWPSDEKGSENDCFQNLFCV